MVNLVCTVLTHPCFEPDTERLTERLDKAVMKLSFRGATYESPFPTLELSDNPLDDYRNGVIWRFQHLKAFMDEQGHTSRKDSGDRILLAIWEPAPITDTRTRPFLFVAKHLLQSEEEAQAILSQYLNTYTQSPVYPPARIFVGSKDAAPVDVPNPHPIH